MSDPQFVKCPQCGFEVRVTDEERRISRSFCTACEARFEVAVDEQVGEGPFRMTARARGNISAIAPTDRIRVTEVDQATTVELSPEHTARERRRKVVAGTGYAAITVATFASFFLSRSFDYGRAIVIFFAGGAAMNALRTRLSREVVRIDHTGFTYERRFGGAARLALEQVVGTRPSGGGLEIQARGGPWPPLRLGTGFGYDLDTLGWLGRQIDRALRRARGGA